MRRYLPSGTSMWCRFVLAAACLACTTAGPSAAVAQDRADAGAPSFSREIQPIFNANCVACHQAAGASGGLNLEEDAAYDAIVSRRSQSSTFPRIAPGKPEESYLVRKLEGTHVQAGGSGERMPPTGPLDRALIGVIRDWVKAGAHKDP